MEDTDLLPSIKVIRFRFLQGWRAAHRAREEVITRLFQQKPGTQLFFFRKSHRQPRKFLKRSCCFPTKAWYAAFLLSKNLIIGSEVSRAGAALFNRYRL